MKLQDFFYPIGSVAGSGKEGQDLAWSFFKDNFAAIKSKLSKASPSLMDAAIVYSAGGFSDAAKAQEVQQFFEQNPMPNNQRKVNLIGLCIYLRQEVCS